MEHLPAERRELVIPTTGIVELRRWTLAGLGDQALLDQPFQRAVQRCWPQPHFSAAALQHVLHDAVAMLLALDQADENVEPVALERQERVGLWFWHADCISHYIYMRQVTTWEVVGDWKVDGQRPVVFSRTCIAVALRESH